MKSIFECPGILISIPLPSLQPLVPAIVDLVPHLLHPPSLLPSLLPDHLPLSLQQTVLTFSFPQTHPERYILLLCCFLWWNSTAMHAHRRVVVVQLTWCLKQRQPLVWLSQKKLAHCLPECTQWQTSYSWLSASSSPSPLTPTLSTPWSFPSPPPTHCANILLSSATSRALHFVIVLFFMMKQYCYAC